MAVSLGLGPDSTHGGDKPDFGAAAAHVTEHP
jgi:hypothetical protein